MKIIVAGSRTFTDKDLLFAKLDYYTSQQSDITIISGDARGADKLGAEWAKARGHKLIIKPANWKLHGNWAGFERNHEMLEIADALVAFWDGQSKGTSHMITISKVQGIPVRVVYY